MSVSFYTKCWEGDWKRMLAGGFERKWQACSYDFDVVGIALNNGVPAGCRDAFPGMADVVIDVPFIEETVRRYYNSPDFKGGDVYSLAELACCLNCPTDYLVYVQGDCMPSTGDFVTEAVAILEEDERIAAVSPASDVNTWHDAFGLDQFFSDQCFVIRTADFRDPLLMAGGPDLPEYPAHGGDSFEKKVAQWMRKNMKFRKILESHRYEHPSY